MILTYQEELFSDSNTCEVGISDHHHLVSTDFSKKVLKGSTKTLFQFYKDYKKLEEDKFGKDLTNELQKIINPSNCYLKKHL